MVNYHFGYKINYIKNISNSFYTYVYRVLGRVLFNNTPLGSFSLVCGALIADYCIQALTLSWVRFPGIDELAGTLEKQANRLETANYMPSCRVNDYSIFLPLVKNKNLKVLWRKLSLIYSSDPTSVRGGTNWVIKNYWHSATLGRLPT